MEDVVRIIRAAKALIQAMEEIQKSPEYLAIWNSAFVHGMKYQGRNWKTEFEALRDAIEDYQRGLKRGIS